MTPERHREIGRLYHAALGMLRDQRETFLYQACANDPELYQQAKALLRAHDQAEDFIETAAPEVMAVNADATSRGISIGQTIAQYRVLSTLGRGGMGEVYLAEDVKLGRKVALKLLPLEFTQDRERISRFEQEARATSALNHPHILTIYEINEINGIRFIATEYVEGETLRDRLDRAPLELRQVLELAMQMVSALWAAHEAGILHRDIKPENLMVRHDDYVKVLDFGLAKLMETATAEGGPLSSNGNQTTSGLVVGTLTYMSPEQLKGAELDGRSDLFSVGVVLYEMLTGIAPFKCETMAETIAAILHRDPAPLSQYSPNIPLGLHRIVEKALAKRRSERYRNAKALLTDLKNLTLDLEVQARLKHTGATQTPEPQIVQHNLPVQLTSFIGRELEIRTLKQMVVNLRMVTLIGAGGCGKTRLALQIASQLQPSFPDGAWFIDLASVNEATMALRALAAALRLHDDGHGPLIHSIASQLKGRDALLVFDNCEHLLEACAEHISHLLTSCPNLRVLATSREPIAISGETVYRVGSLSVPAKDTLTAYKELVEYEAVRLFVDRARSFDAAFKITDQNAEAIVHICRCLDGIPLAIELAASRVRTVSLTLISSHLQDVFALLTTGGRGVLPRHRTLRAAIEWSYNLLTAAEQAIFSRCSVFTGSWTLEAAEVVCAGGDVQREDVLDLMCHLVDKSLVVAETRNDELRYRLLSTIGQYAAKMLLAKNDDKSTHFRHAAFFLDIAGAADEKLNGFEQVRWLALLENEHDNIRSALSWSLENDVEKMLSATRGLHQFWLIHGHFGEGRSWLERVLAHAAMASITIKRAQALRQVGVMALRQTDYAGAEQFLKESLEIGEKLGDLSSVASTKIPLGVLALELEDLETAGHLWQESLSVFRDLDDTRGVAYSLFHLGVLARRQSDYSAAQERYQEALEIFESQGNTFGSAACINNLASLARYQEDYATAGALALRGLLLRKDLSDKRGIVDSLELLADLRARLQKHREAVCLLAAAEKLRRRITSPRSPAEQAEKRSDTETATAALGPGPFKDAWEKGSAMSFEEMLAFTLNLSFSDVK